ncbi:helix-turn-helix transcriptional regulator [Nocardioides sp.]|uniref:helix-turn-helix transcriptional regulator n=1 Tax=Nocardioides sp. TaxID=35761 RepID=UPI00356236A7
MAAPPRHGRTLAQIGEICARATDPRTLRLQVLDLLDEVVPHDAFAWLLTDPETAVGSSPIADVPWLPRLPEAIRLKYLTPVNRWTSMSGPVSRLGEVTGGDLSRSRLWAELLADYDVSDLISAVFLDAYGCWGFLDLWRIGDRAGFSPEDEDLLVTITAALTAALRRLQASSLRATKAANSAPGHDGGPVVMLLSPDLTVLSQTAETEAYLRTIVPTEQGRSPVPATAYNVAAQLLAVEAGVDDHPPLTRLHVADGHWVSMSAARLGATGPLEDRTIAVTLQRAGPADRLALFARASGLTARETELVRHLGDGVDTRQLARRLGVAEHTVQDHLKAIFAKTSTGSRLELLSRVFGG